MDGTMARHEQTEQVKDGITTLVLISIAIVVIPVIAFFALSDITFFIIGG